MMGTIVLTERGFELIEFLDSNDVKCSIQQSSRFTSQSDATPGASFIWLGADSIRISTGQGVIPVSLTRMHLSRIQVRTLVHHLLAWLETGSFEYDKETADMHSSERWPLFMTADEYNVIYPLIQNISDMVENDCVYNECGYECEFDAMEVLNSGWSHARKAFARLLNMDIPDSDMLDDLDPEDVDSKYVCPSCGRRTESASSPCDDCVGKRRDPSTETVSVAKLLNAAAEVFANIKNNKGVEYPHATLMEAFGSFNHITTTHGLAWLIDGAEIMSHLGYAQWMQEARHALSLAI